MFAVCWGPNEIFYALQILYEYSFQVPFYWWSVVMGFLNVSLNPSVYAYKHETIRKQVNKWLRVDGGGGVGPITEPGTSFMPGSVNSLFQSIN